MKYLPREALFAFRRAPLLTGLSILTIAFALYTLAVFGLIWMNIERVLEDVESRVEVIVYLEDGADPGASAILMSEVATYPEVDSLSYVSKADALARAREEMREYGELYEDLEVNPLPASVEIALKPGFRRGTQVRDVADRVARFAFVEDVRYGHEWVSKLNFLQDLSLFLGLVVGGIFAVVAFIAIGATINLVLIAREDEFAIMKMVGATPAFIAQPFVLEGFIKGVVGAVLALALLTATFEALEQRVVSLAFYSPGQIVAGVALGGVLGAVGAVFSLRAPLRNW